MTELQHFSLSQGLFFLVLAGGKAIPHVQGQVSGDARLKLSRTSMPSRPGREGRGVAAGDFCW